jgi:hypothetical protein
MSRGLHVSLRWICCGAILPLVAAAMVAGGGCASATTQPDYADPTTQALDNPMNYKPNFDNSGNPNSGIGDFDSKGFNRDVDHVVNP